MTVVAYAVEGQHLQRVEIAAGVFTDDVVATKQYQLFMKWNIGGK